MINNENPSLDPKKLLTYELHLLESALYELGRVVRRRGLRAGPRPPKGIDLGCGICLIINRLGGDTYELWRESSTSGGPYPCNVERLAEDIIINTGRRPRAILRALNRIRARRLWALNQIQVWGGQR